MANDNRPLSPHLTIYRWQISSVLSILHRLTGFALTVGTLVLAWFLWSAAYSQGCYDCLVKFLTHPLGIFFLAGWSFAFYYHLANGIRHLFWDIGLGFTLPVMNRSGITVVIFSLAATAATWWYVYSGVPAHG